MAFGRQGVQRRRADVRRAKSAMSPYPRSSAKMITIFGGDACPAASRRRAATARMPERRWL
jgi:hypothetical protein